MQDELELLKKENKLLKDLLQLETTKHIETIAQKEAKLDDKLKQVSYLFKSMQEGMWDWHIQTGKLSHNDTWFNALGYSEKELSGTIEDFKMVLHQDDVETVFTRVTNAIQNNEPYFSEHRLVAKDGSIVYVHDRGYVVEFEEDKPSRMVGSFINITRQKKVEQELKKLNNELEKKIEETTQEVLEKDRILASQTRMAMMGEMISSIAHQWRQPLNTLGIVVQTLLYDYKDGLVNESYILDFKKMAMRSINSMSRTIDDFRNFFAPSKDREKFCVLDASKEAYAVISASLNNIPIKVNFIGNETLKVFGFKGEFEQVILNLLSNAKDAILERDIKNGEITISAASENSNAIIEISDNGCGIKQDAIDRIFNPYFTTKDEGRGTGIGLYMSKLIIEKHHNGKLIAANGANGAKFTIILPLNAS